MAETKKEEDPLEEFVENFMMKMDLKGKEIMIKIKKFAKDLGLDYEKVKEEYISDSKIEEFAKNIMEESGIEGITELKAIKDFIKSEKSEKAIIIGGGLLGLELANQINESKLKTRFIKNK